ncbi:MAG TPA: lipoprotein B transmembrane [Gammaproteobacteria bacterium]|nr:lipoprotein B transmembrane [Gammaproteobacteria bacterium]
MTFKKGLINPSCRRRPASNALNLLDSGLRRNDERRINQDFLNRCCNTFAMLLLLTSLSACGFKLRGDVELPQILQETYIESKNPFTGMARALRTELEGAGARIVESSKQATAVLRIVNEKSVNRILSVGSTGKASEYELFDSVTFELTDHKGKALISPQNLSMIRDLVFDENELLGKVAEAEQLHIKMRRSLARQVFTHINVELKRQ